MAPNGPEKWGCRMRIRDLFSKIRDLLTKIRDLFSTTRLRDQKTTGAPAPASLAPMLISYLRFRPFQYIDPKLANSS